MKLLNICQNLICFLRNIMFENETPQGSSIRPLLFLIMINNIKLSNSKVHLSLFANDTAIWTESSDINNGIIVLQHLLKELENWSKKWGFKFLINKTKAMIFSCNKFENHINLKIDNHDIEPVNLNF